MASLQHIKKRLSGIRNINQMTEAMELVAATKMRRAQETALASRYYAVTALEMLANIADHLIEPDGTPVVDISHLKLFATPRRVKTTAVLVVTADKGLAGSFNSAIFRRLEKYSKFGHTDGSSLVYIPVGQKAVDYLRRRNLPAAKEFTKYGDLFNLSEIEPVYELIIDGFMKNKWQRVLVFSTHFFSAIRQEVLERQLLPVNVNRIRSTVEELIPESGRYSEFRENIIASRPERPLDYIIEPSPREALEHLVPLLVRMEIYHLMLEANASEHSARRMAMKNASDNAKDLISNLVLEFNRSRQEAVTREVSEIVGTTVALKK